MDVESENVGLLSPQEDRSISEVIHPSQVPSNPLRNSRPQSPPSNGCCCGASSICSKNAIYGWITFLFCLSLFVLIGFLKYESDQRYKTLLTKYITLQTQLNTVETNNNARYTILKNNVDVFQSTETAIENKLTATLQSQNISTMTHVNHLWQTVTQHDKAIIRLSNGTSNADVLDKLKQTKTQIDEILGDTKIEINHQLQSATVNVTTQLEHSREEFQETQQAVKDHLDATVIRMKSVVTDATDNIYRVQKNVTNQIHLMGITLSQTVDDLTQNVHDAQDVIDEKVEAVKNNIEQYVAFTNKQFAAENDFVKYQLAGLFTLLSCLIFLWHLTQHMRHYSKPDIQNRIMGILWMVPIYGVTSWLSMMSVQSEPYLAAFRDCFESYVVYTFVGFLIAALSDGQTRPQLILKLAREVEHERLAVERFNRARDNPVDIPDENTKLVKPKEHLVPPCPCCYKRDPISTARSWLNQCQLFAMQFVFVKPLLTIIPLILNVSHVYNMDEIPAFVNNNVNWISPKLYVLILQNLSVGFAFYGLLSFYHGVERDLEWCEPWPKFLCIKGVVFLTFWQSITIQIMGTFGLVDEKAANQISNLLICIEMLIASIAHFYIFPYQEWAPGYQRAKQKSILLRDTMAFGDFLKDMRSMFTKDSLNQTLDPPESPDKSAIMNHDVSEIAFSSPLRKYVEEQDGKKLSLTEMTATKREKGSTLLTDQEVMIMEELEEKISLLTKLSNEETTNDVSLHDKPRDDEYYQSSPNTSPRATSLLEQHYYSKLYPDNVEESKDKSLSPLENV